MGLQGFRLIIPLLLLLKSLFNDFNLPSAEAKGDDDEVVASHSLGISILNIPFPSSSRLLLLFIVLSPLDDDEEVFCSEVVDEEEEVIWLWLPQIKTFVGKAAAAAAAADVDDSTSTTTTTEEGGGVAARVVLQRGQVEWEWNHISMQSM